MAPPKGRSKAKNSQFKKIGEFSKNTKVLNQMDLKIKEQSDLIDGKNRQINKVKCRLQRKERRLAHLKRELLEKSHMVSSLQRSHMKPAFVLSRKKVSMRKKDPTSVKTPHTSRVVRRNETMGVCSMIHGECSPYGVLDTLTSKFKAKELVQHVMGAKPSFVKELEKTILTKKEKEYYESEDNLLRSLNIYYCHSVMGKAKYISNRKANKNNDNIPNYVPYKKLSDYINSIDIGEVRCLQNDFGKDLSAEDCGNGVYRPLVNYVQRISKFYLTVYPQRKDTLKQFETFKKQADDSFLFLLNYGGDGAPGSGTVFLISYLNTTQRLMSSRENFSVFGANCDEKSLVVLRYLRQVMSDLTYLENNIFEIKVTERTIKVEYKLAELPNDMKMLCFLASELSNSAYYFTTFANANQSDCDDLTKKNW